MEEGKLSHEEIDMLGRRLSEIYPGDNPVDFNAPELRHLIHEIPDFEKPTFVLDADSLEHVRNAWHGEISGQTC